MGRRQLAVVALLRNGALQWDLAPSSPAKYRAMRGRRCLWPRPSGSLRENRGRCQVTRLWSDTESIFRDVEYFEQTALCAASYDLKS
ncbi:hypothetical protein L209DRAFT_755694 [Thermothelomyces heterothallicus CBS 203.75]